MSQTEADRQRDWLVLEELRQTQGALGRIMRVRVATEVVLLRELEAAGVHLTRARLDALVEEELRRDVG